MLRLRLTITALMALIATSAIADEFSHGPVSKVADGDTFTVVNEGKKVRVRFCGVDSPEREQPRYAEAARELARLVEGKAVRCIQVGGGTPCDGKSRATNRDRIVAQCFVDDRDLAMEMGLREHGQGHAAVFGWLLRELQTLTD